MARVVIFHSTAAVYPVHGSCDVDLAPRVISKGTVSGWCGCSRPPVRKAFTTAPGGVAVAGRLRLLPVLFAHQMQTAGTETPPSRGLESWLLRREGPLPFKGLVETVCAPPGENKFT